VTGLVFARFPAHADTTRKRPREIHSPSFDAD
jgi:hypothetical protein